MILYDDETWMQHINAAGLDDVSLEDYYLGEDKAEHCLISAATQQHLLNELLQDAIDVGAIVFPACYRYDDVSLAVEVDSSDPEQRLYKIGVIHKALPGRVFYDGNNYAHSTHNYVETPLVASLDEDERNTCVHDADSVLAELSEILGEFFEKHDKDIRPAKTSEPYKDFYGQSDDAFFWKQLMGTERREQIREQRPTL